jgi:phenylpropionate dioxygenase-like ring-hydroxylating dioxygenase large terminal subunit
MAIAEFETKFGGDLSTLKSRVDIAQYLTGANFEREVEKIFRREWLLVAHTDDVPEKGSYFVQDVPTLKTSLLILRGTDDQVRVFYNACTHRGNKLVREGAGCRVGFMCGFHGWVFTPDGALKTITDEHQFEDRDKVKEELGLVPVRSEVWNGFVFVNFDTNAPTTLKEYLANFYDEYEGYFESQELISFNRIVVNCNWHLAVNSFTEGYHTLILHRNTARDYLGGRNNKNRHRPWFEVTDRHHRMTAPGNPEHVILDVEGLAIKYGRKILPAFDFDMTGMPKGINPARTENFGFDNVAYFPNTVMLMGNTYRIEMTFWPVDAGHTVFLNRVYVYKPKTLGERLSQAYFRARGRDVMREDVNTLEAQHEMMSSGAIKEVVLSRQETAVKHHYRVLEKYLSS